MSDSLPYLTNNRHCRMAASELTHLRALTNAIKFKGLTVNIIVMQTLAYCLHYPLHVWHRDQTHIKGDAHV
ncbi:MAG: hypothetical protein CMQ46_14455 [Gammaproteobacteria bacterium]|jgi:hypothetical protein|nr:hypothetical protein [Gammaproteobacteria bacterium]MBJ55611.1 hypothetical protein [Gammaproteobacteria bacterium]MBJ56446.1 hypothetical protein [Gammaproteobacteria bacterium]HBN14234.1 hypothetical protein [Pseudohongiella sp.]